MEGTTEGLAWGRREGHVLSTSTSVPLAPPPPFAPTPFPGSHSLNPVPNAEDVDCVPWEQSSEPPALQ